MSWQARNDNYHRETRLPDETVRRRRRRRVVGTWIMGQNYTVKSNFYGGYPAGYLRRVKALFPDKRSILHLFSGKVDTTIMPGDTVDINADYSPTWVDDAETLEEGNHHWKVMI